MSADNPLGRSTETTGPIGGVEVGDDCLGETGQRAADAGSEERVHDEIGAEHVRAVQFPRPGVGDLDDVAAHGAQHREIRARIALDLRGLADEVDADVDTTLEQYARDDEAVAAVVAAPAEHATRRLSKSSNADSITATTCRPAFSMRTIDAMPTSSIVRRSASRICRVLSTRMRGGSEAATTESATAGQTIDSPQ